MLLEPDKTVVCITDCEPQMFLAIDGISRNETINAIQGLIKTAQVFEIPLIFSAVRTSKQTGPLFKITQPLYPKAIVSERAGFNAWDEPKFKNAVEKTGKRSLIFAGMWTELSVTMPVLSALSDDFGVYVITDACAGLNRETHDTALQRMVQAGAEPLTWLSALFEMQRSREIQGGASHEKVRQIIAAHGGAYSSANDYFS